MNCTVNNRSGIIPTESRQLWALQIAKGAPPAIGWQATRNLSGSLGGPTVGVPGPGLTITYGLCD